MVIQAPISGPITGAIRAGQVMVAIARTSSPFGAPRKTSWRPTGVISAADAPWNSRATVNCKSEPEKPQATEDSVNSTIEVRKTSRAPKRSASQPAGAMNTAMASR